MLSSKNVLSSSSQPSGLDMFKNALKTKLNLGGGIADFIDDKTSIYEAEYKTDLK